MEIPKEPLKIKNHSYYTQKYYKKLSEKSATVEPLTSLCAGWHLETFKQVINKLSKNKSSPMPLLFSNIDCMDSISKNKALLRKVFKCFDTRNLGKIDACELYAICMILSKGSYENYLKTVVDVFGFETPGSISRQEMFFYLDSLYRGLPKVLILQGYSKSTQEEGNVRLDFRDINKFIEMLFEDQQLIQRREIYEIMMKAAELNDFIRYVQKRCLASADSTRSNAIEIIKIEADVRDVMLHILGKIEQNLKNYLL